MQVVAPSPPEMPPCLLEVVFLDRGCLSIKWDSCEKRARRVRWSFPVSRRVPAGGIPLFYKASSVLLLLGDDLKLIDFAEYTPLFVLIPCIKWSS